MRILVTGHVYYHSNNAAKFRTLEVVRALQSLGHEVAVFDGLSQGVPIPYGEAPLPRIERGRPPVRWRDRIATSLGIGFSLLAHPIARERFEAVYCYGTELSWVLATWRVARRNGARLIVDVPELYGLEGMTTSLSALRTRISGWLGIFPVVPMLADGVVVPSRRFVRLFRRGGANVQRVPPFFAEFVPRTDQTGGSEALTLAYAGSPSNKEWLSLIFRALHAVPIAAEQRIVFRLVGLNPADVDAVARQSGVAEVLARDDIRIEALGQTDVATARDVVQAADFAIVIRRPSTRVNFGFPSKVAEAFRLETPVISNFYSDIADYLEDGKNGWALTHETEAGLSDILSRCLSLSAAEKAAMRSDAAETGRRFFSPQSVTAALDALIHDGAPR